MCLKGGYIVRENMRNIRVEKSFTVTYISDILGISPSYYYKIEQGIRNPNLYLAKSIAEILETNLENIFF